MQTPHYNPIVMDTKFQLFLMLLEAMINSGGGGSGGGVLLLYFFIQSLSVSFTNIKILKMVFKP